MVSSQHDVAQLYERYGSLVYRRALHLLKNEQEAQDAMQDTFIRALQNLDTFRQEAAPSTWLYRITTNLCLNRIRDRKPHDHDATEHLTQTFGGQSTDRIDAETILKNTPDALKEVAIYHYVDDMDQDEIAELIGMSRRTVSHRLAQFRAHAQQFSAHDPSGDAL